MEDEARRSSVVASDRRKISPRGKTFNIPFPSRGPHFILQLVQMITSSEIMLFFRENAIMSRSSVPSCGYSRKSISIAFKRPGLSTNSILGPT